MGYQNRHIDSTRNRLSRGFGLVELLVAMAIGILLLMLAIPIFTNFFNEQRLRRETVYVESVIRKTMSEAIAKGFPARVQISGATITGSIATDATGTVYNDIVGNAVTLEHCQFARSDGGLLTPFLQSSETTSLLDPADDTPTLSAESDAKTALRQLTFNSMGVPSSGSVVFLEFDDRVAVIEIMASGLLVISHQEGEDAWSR